MVNKQVALGADATAEDFEDALDAAIDDPEVDAVVAVYIPPLNVSGEDVANVLAAVGEQSDKPLVSTFLGAEGVPELLRVPDVAGSTRRPRLGAVVPRGRGRGPGAGPGRRVRRVAAHPGRRAARRRRSSTGPPRAARQRAADATTPTARDLDRRRAARAARGVRHRPVGRPVRSPPSTRRWPPARSSAGTSCSRPPPTTCGTAPTWPTCGATSTPPAEMRDAWETLQPG